MRRNGFTFIEILGVITLLALLSIIVLTVVDKNLKDSKNTLKEVQIENIKSAASMWRTDNIELIPDSGYYVITLGELIDLGYLKEDIVDPGSNSSYDNGLTLGVGVDEIKIDSIDNLLALSGYTKLDYIMSDGSQYIDLGYKAKKNTEIRLDIQFVPNENTDSDEAVNQIISKVTRNFDDTFQINFGASVFQLQTIFYWLDKISTAGGVSYSVYYDSVLSRSTMVVKSGSATFQNITIQVAIKTADNSDGMILLGGFNPEQNNVVAFNRYDAKVYGFQIYEGDTLVMNMMPYLKNGKAGLYDFVSKRFYTSNGSEDFQYGELE